MGSDDLDVLMPGSTIPVLVLDAGIRETDVAIVVRQLVLPCPARDLFGLTIRPAIAVFPAAIALVEESLIIASCVSSRGFLTPAQKVSQARSWLSMTPSRPMTAR